MIDKTKISYHPLNQYLTEYKELNTDNLHRPVAVGRYGIRTRESIYSKELAKDYSKNKLIYKGTLTVGMGSVQMDIGILSDDETYSVSPAYHTYRISNINYDYLRYCLQCRNKDMFIRYMKRGSRQGKSIDLRRWITYEIPVYPMQMQEEIVDRLDRVQKIIDAREVELQSLDELIKARFVELFDLGNVGWGTFGEDTDFIDYRGKTPELSAEGTIRMVNAKSVGRGSFKYVDEFVTEETYDEWMHRGFGYPGDVLFVTEGHTFGNTCRVPNNLHKFALGQRVITIKGHEDVINNAFLCSYMQTDNFWKDINVYRTGGTAQGIRSKDLIRVKIPKPQFDVQKEFESFVNQVDKSKVVVQKSLEETQLLFDSLMQEYFG